MYIFIWLLSRFYVVYIFVFLIILILSLWHLKSNKVLKMKLGSFKIEIKRKKFLKFLIVPIFIIPIIVLLLIFSYNTENTILDLSNEYALVDDIVYRDYILFGPSYDYTTNEGKIYSRSDYGAITELHKMGNMWIGYIEDENKMERPYYDRGVDADENADKIYRMMIVSKIEEVKGYFIINEKEAVFGLTEEEVEKRINKKVKFFYPPIYYLKKYGEKD